MRIGLSLQGFKMADKIPHKIEKIVHRIEPTEVGQLLRDPAIEKWASMKETTTKHFRVTGYTSRLALLWFVAVPFGLFTAIKYSQWIKDDKLGRPRTNFIPGPMKDD